MPAAETRNCRAPSSAEVANWPARSVTSTTSAASAPPALSARRHGDDHARPVDRRPRVVDDLPGDRHAVAQGDRRDFQALSRHQPQLARAVRHAAGAADLEEDPSRQHVGQLEPATRIAADRARPAQRVPRARRQAGRLRRQRKSIGDHRQVIAARHQTAHDRARDRRALAIDDPAGDLGAAHQLEDLRAIAADPARPQQQLHRPARHEAGLTRRQAILARGQRTGAPLPLGVGVNQLGQGVLAGERVDPDFRARQRPAGVVDDATADHPARTQLQPTAGGRSPERSRTTSELTRDTSAPRAARKT